MLSPIFFIPAISLGIFIIIIFSSLRFQKKVENSHETQEQVMIDSLSPNIRPIVLGGFISFLFLGSAVVYLLNREDGAASLTRFYGLTSFILLFLTLTPGLLRVYFPNFILNSLLIKMRRALGVSAFIFALMHGVMAFIFYYGATLNKIFAMDPIHQTAFYFGLSTLVIMAIMAVTSFDKIVEKLTFKVWKNLHRLIYLGAAMVIFHAFIKGVHFSENILFQSGVLLLIFLFIFLEVGATALQLLNSEEEHSPSTDKKPKWQIIFWMIVLIIISFVTFYFGIEKLNNLY